jgi:uncharacterized delta-60 repeat protein
MRKIFLAVLSITIGGCGNGLCPLRTNVGCSSGGSNFTGAIGTLDTSFNSTGIVTTPVLAGLDSITGAVIQPDGKIITAGLADSGGFIFDFGVVRYHSNGSLDTTFNTTGIVTTPILADSDQAYSIALQSDGKIIVAGSAFNGANDDFAVVRYHSNGSLDTTFNTTGKVTTPILAVHDYATSVAIQSDGKIVLAGYAHNGANNDFALTRYHANGSLDTTFNTTGKVTTPILASNDLAYGLAIQSDGKIVLAGYAHNGANEDFAVARYNSDGSLDTTFNTTGKVTTPVLSSTDIATSIVLQPDGKIVLAGYANNGTDNDFALVRYHANGSLDTTFNATGKVTTPILASSDIANSVTIQPDGKIIAAGSAFNGANADFAVVRYR